MSIYIFIFETYLPTFFWGLSSDLPPWGVMFRTRTCFWPQKLLLSEAERHCMKACCWNIPNIDHHLHLHCKMWICEYIKYINIAILNPVPGFEILYQFLSEISKPLDKHHILLALQAPCGEVHLGLISDRLSPQTIDHYTHKTKIKMEPKMEVWKS